MGMYTMGTPMDEGLVLVSLIRAIVMVVVCSFEYAVCTGWQAISTHFESSAVGLSTGLLVGCLV
jgi:hypothetical protein